MSVYVGVGIVMQQLAYLTTKVMTDFQEHLARVAHVPERNVPYYIRWVRQAYELADRPLGEPLSPDLEQHSKGQRPFESPVTKRPRI